MFLQILLGLVAAGATGLGVAGAIAYAHEVATTRADRLREATQPAAALLVAPARPTGTVDPIAALPDPFRAGCLAAERELSAGLERVTAWAYRKLGERPPITVPATPAPDLLLLPGWSAPTPLPAV
jgi:hypothetical protein